jgi:hypothetical protein
MGGIGSGKKGEENPQWKGDEVGIDAIHGFIKRIKPKSDLCQICLGNICGNKKPFELINIKNHVYTRYPLDYRWGSHKCHSIFDKAELVKEKNPFYGKHHTEATKQKTENFILEKLLGQKERIILKRQNKRIERNTSVKSHGTKESIRG